MSPSSSVIVKDPVASALVAVMLTRVIAIWTSASETSPAKPAPNDAVCPVPPVKFVTSPEDPSDDESTASIVRVWLGPPE